MIRRRHPSMIAVALTAAAIAAPAGAQPKPGGAPRTDPIAAEALWKEGRALRAAGKLREACPKFEESYRLDPALGALLNLASCHELLGRTATAWSEYREAEDLAVRAGDEKRRKFAAQRAAAIEEKVPRLVITAIDPPPGLVVLRDGVELGAATLGAAIPIDPGEHVITARAPGFEAWTVKYEASTGARGTIEVPRLAPLPAPPPAAASAPAASAPPDRAAAPGARLPVLAIVAGGVGLAGIGVGAVFGVLTGNQASAARDECPEDVCNAKGDELVARGETYAWVSNIGFGVGALGLVVGGVLLLTGSSGPEPPPAAAAAGRFSVAPALGPEGGGVRASVRF
ncbi:MAG: tetratricopeptide repeat protein [Polyangiaceae bacterium]|nr:tetratricopeptide repeat protein [Polyangiaceae bacterium]